MNVPSRFAQPGFSLIEMVLALALLAALGAAVFVVYPRVMISVNAAHDQAAMRTAFANITTAMRAGGRTSFNTDPNSSEAGIAQDPAVLAQLLKPLDCTAPDGWLECRAASAPYVNVDFMSVATCQDSGCSSMGAPYRVFSMRIAFYDVSTETCLALAQGFTTAQSAVGNSAIYVVGSDWSYKPLFLNTASIEAVVDACQDPTGVNTMQMFDFWPWGDAFGMYPGYGG